MLATIRVALYNSPLKTKSESLHLSDVVLYCTSTSMHKLGWDAWEAASWDIDMQKLCDMQQTLGYFCWSWTCMLHSLLVSGWLDALPNVCLREKPVAWAIIVSSVWCDYMDSKGRHVVHEWMNVWMDQWRKEQPKEQMPAWVNVQMNEQTNHPPTNQMNDWLNKWLNEWMYACMNDALR